MKIRTIHVIKDKKFEEYIKNYLADRTGVISIEEVMKEVESKWPKNTRNLNRKQLKK